MRIMIADDAGFIREILREVYTNAGHEIVAEVSSGPDAVLVALNLRPDLVIMDIVMPGLNGLEAATEITSQDTEIAVAATSSLSTDWIEENAKKAGCFYFLQKPFTKEQLLRVIEMVNIKKGYELKHG